MVVVYSSCSGLVTITRVPYPSNPAGAKVLIRLGEITNFRVG
jgi:tRNA(Phe) wybutosine-synthesizing methylase Tyw3